MENWCLKIFKRCIMAFRNQTQNYLHEEGKKMHVNWSLLSSIIEIYCTLHKFDCIAFYSQHTPIMMMMADTKNRWTTNLFKTSNWINFRRNVEHRKNRFCCVQVRIKSVRKCVGEIKWPKKLPKRRSSEWVKQWKLKNKILNTWVVCVFVCLRVGNWWSPYSAAIRNKTVYYTLSRTYIYWAYSWILTL